MQDGTPELRGEADERARNGAPAPIFAVRFPDDAPAGDRPDGGGPRLSVVAPMYNEEGGAAALVGEIAQALKEIPHEIIVVDDCSRDGTRAVLEKAMDDFPTLRVLTHGANAGQSRAVRTGVLAARAPIVVTLDGDGQNDPADIPALHAALSRAEAPALLAMVAGERVKRVDSAAKRWASRAANAIRARALRDGAADTGCGLKAFYREAYMRLPYFDHMHRYLPALMRREGFHIEFRKVSHRARAHGTSKYTNWGRLAVAFRDMLGVMWLNDRARRPIDITEL
ncbi:MAG: glycosyltransferase family 2 protein [Pseudomonadota bacterium]